MGGLRRFSRSLLYADAWGYTLPRYGGHVSNSLTDGGYVSADGGGVLVIVLQMGATEFRSHPDGGCVPIAAFEILFRWRLRFRRWGRRSQLLCRWGLRWCFVNVNASVNVCLCDFYHENGRTTS